MSATFASYSTIASALCLSTVWYSSSPLIPAGKVKPVDQGSQGFRYRGRIAMGVTGTWAEKTRFWIPRKGCLQLDDKTCGIAVVKHRWRVGDLGRFFPQVGFQRDPSFFLPANCSTAARDPGRPKMFCTSVISKGLVGRLIERNSP